MTDVSFFVLFGIKANMKRICVLPLIHLRNDSALFATEKQKLQLRAQSLFSVGLGQVNLSLTRYLHFIDFKVEFDSPKKLTRSTPRAPS